MNLLKYNGLIKKFELMYLYFFDIIKLPDIIIGNLDRIKKYKYESN